MVELAGYQIHEMLYSSARTLVYRGTREFDQKSVVIKLQRQEYPRFNELVKFRNQYTIAKNLNLPGIIQTYRLENYLNGYALVMEFGGISLSDYLTNQEQLRTLSLQQFFYIAIQIASILDKLYRNRVIHKDIKPANILIDPVTDEVKLIDFSIASLLPRETQTLTSAEVLEGTLAYLSPEQTGRMNRGIDYRTDFYSLGVTFFELLTGQLPFQSDDPMELVHSHLAKLPPKAHSLNLNIPQQLSEIISKLMAKNAEDRYQSALGLKYDLENCLQQWETSEVISTFELGQRDICDRFQIPERLYGRQKEVTTLLQAFERVATGLTDNDVSQDNNSSVKPANRSPAEMMLVAGFSGIGKTAVINEVHKPIVRERGYFIRGKFDQFLRNIPFLAFVQAFRDLMGQLLSESDPQLEKWKTKILKALGENSQVIIEVIPELEHIIGKQPSVSELSGNAAQNRFNLLFQKFIQVFTTKEHPLVIFLDDLQWADSASLNLIQLLMSETETRYLLLIGAYRDNEVSAAHPVTVTLEEICSSGAMVNTITLTPLNPSDLNHLVADTLNCSSQRAEPLTQLVYQKTKGNPFFANQFLRALHEDGYINFNFDEGYWQCDIARVKAIALTDDVVEFMALQLQKLPVATQSVLKLAACIGNQFDLETLTIVYEKPLVETAMDLWKALQEGFIIPKNEIYKFFHNEPAYDRLLTTNKYEQLAISNEQLAIHYNFLHDRVQQAAYSLIPEDSKQATHLKIGQLLLKNTPLAEREEKIFEIVNHFNLSRNLISTEREKQNLAQLNLQAGQKAKLSTAYQAAKNYFTIGLELLSATSWEDDYTLTYELYKECSETEYLSGNFEEAELLYAEALKRTVTVLDKVGIYYIQMTQYQLQGKYAEAIAIQKASLDLLGLSISLEPEALQAALNAELNAVNTYLKEHKIDELLDAPKMSNPNIIAMLRLLQVMFYSAYLIGNQTLGNFTLVKMTTLSLQYGNSDSSPFGYVGYGLVAGVLDDYKTGYSFGEMAVKLCEQFDNSYIKCQTNFLFAADVHNWNRSIKLSETYYENAYKFGLESGDWVTIGYMIIQSCSDRLTRGQNLSELYQLCQTYLNFLYQVKNQDIIELLYAGVIQPIYNLQGLTYSQSTFDNQDFSEAKYLSKYKDLPYYLAWFYYIKIRNAYIFDERDTWLHLIDKLSIVENFVPSHSKVPSTFFYVALMYLALHSSASHSERQKNWEQLTRLEERLLFWADNCPENILHKYLLVQAEKARVRGQMLEAIDYYDRAIAKAKEHEYIHEEALGNELAAKFYLEWGKEKIAQAYLTDAYYGYARWGAKAKVEDLEKRYPQLLALIQQREKIYLDTYKTLPGVSQPLSHIHNITQTFSSSSTTISEALDLASVIKASQTLSSEIQLEKLLSKLMQVIIENAGAEQGFLILPKVQNLEIAIQCFSGEDCHLRSEPIQNSPELPVSIINYVSRTLETLVIHDAASETAFARDVYIIHREPKSLLCAPILNKGKLIGMIYLENNQCTGAFTSDRLETISLLCSQAAISLENSLLYEQLEDYSRTLELKVEERTKELKAAQKQIVAQEKLASLGQLTAGVAHEIRNPLNFVNNFAALSVDLAQELLEEIENQCQKLENGTVDYIKSIVTDLITNVEDIQNQGKRADSIIQNMLLLARSDSKSQRQITDINALIAESIQLVYHSLQSKYQEFNIDIELDCDRTLPKVAIVSQDLSRSLINIIDNACYSAYQKQKTLGGIFVPKVSVMTQKFENSLLITIEDNGQGIAADNIDKIFNPFFTTKPAGEGTGLGLSLVHDIVVGQHQGNIRVQTELGEFTRFMIDLPISDQ
ncbi:serine/threonine protein kinase [Scytonema hofmannii PCC 7110]|uniref:histidine kinase n=1 Tax=Scytonema hofmannii PCC 7110 TaxID=128403 RepID=A0A139XHI2_9CYAN|nr:AAA family ATPase [Scytonema hofmannii]KYC44145.1 serine/threonine protein kinase [Scytonema hofmannii PCC 7110]